MIQQVTPANMRLQAPRIPVLEASRARRRAYAPKPPREFNIILACDSYKFSHQFSYPTDLVGMTSYIEARTGGRQVVVPFGYQAALQKFLRKPFTAAQIDEAEAFARAHGEPFNRAIWEHILAEYGGHMPVLIRAVPEGLPVRSGNAIVTITCVDEHVAKHIFWLCSFLETFLLRLVWYPTTIASLDWEFKNELKQLYETSGASLDFLPFALHDFAGRGVTCHEQAQIGGAAHLVNFMGSDTVEGVTYANYWYTCDMSAFSVYATEHSVACSFGLSREDEIAYISHQLDVAEREGIKIVSMVGDSKDVFRFTELLCTVFRERIMDLHERLGVKVVCRPDSGDALEVLPRLRELFAAAFPTSRTEKGYVRLYGGVGLLQGDGIDRMTGRTIAANFVAAGYAADQIVLGSGGGLLQAVTRDTMKWAQKASAVLRPVDGELRWVGIVKDPITDPGKKSKEGMLTLVRSTMTNQYMTARIDQGPLDSEWVDVMEDVYDCGQFFNDSTMDEVRARAANGPVWRDAA